LVGWLFIVFDIEQSICVCWLSEAAAKVAARIAKEAARIAKEAAEEKARREAEEADKAAADKAAAELKAAEAELKAAAEELQKQQEAAEENARREAADKAAKEAEKSKPINFERRQKQPRNVLKEFLSEGIPKPNTTGGDPAEELLNTSEITFVKQIDDIIDSKIDEDKYKEFYTNIKTYYKELNNIDLINSKIDDLENKVTNITYTRAKEQVNINNFEKYFYLTELIDFLEILVLYKQFEQIKNKLISSDIIYKLKFSIIEYICFI
jgi:hypothetical protein